MNILVTGGNGQLAQCIKSKNINTSKYNYIFASHDELDITSPKDINDFLLKNNIDIVINCAAYTAVDKAEDDYINADKINRIGVINLYDACLKANAKLIHISTDFVYGHGDNQRPYTEDDATFPLSVYGLTKLRGEDYIKKDSIIIRTSWLYSQYGNNFFKTMLSRIKNKLFTKVVSDQIGTPTYAVDLANTIIYLIESNKYKEMNGIYNYSNLGLCSWYDFAASIETIYNSLSKKETINCINPCTTEEYPTKAERPKYSVMSKDKIAKLGVLNRHWLEALYDCMRELYTSCPRKSQ